MIYEWNMFVNPSSFKSHSFINSTNTYNSLHLPSLRYRVQRHQGKKSRMNPL